MTACSLKGAHVVSEYGTENRRSIIWGLHIVWILSSCSEVSKFSLPCKLLFKLTILFNIGTRHVQYIAVRMQRTFELRLNMHNIGGCVGWLKFILFASWVITLSVFNNNGEIYRCVYVWDLYIPNLHNKTKRSPDSEDAYVFSGPGTR